MALFAAIPGNPTTIGLKSPSRTPFGHLKLVTLNNIKATMNNIHKSHFPPLKLGEELVAMKAKKVLEALEEAIPLKHPEEIHKAMRYSVFSGGKRLRPTLCLASCELVGGDENSAMPTACAVEMVQAMSLILDDLPCMDDEDIRRGKPATHKVFGEETAILAASSLLSLSFQHIAERSIGVPLDRVVGAIVELGSAVGSLGVLGGELLDVHCEGKEVSMEELENICVAKSSKLLEASVVCGAIIGGGNEMEIQRLRKYARHLGLGCQILNDIQDIIMSTEELGRTAGKDLENDKATYTKFMGIEESKRFSQKLIGQAMEEIALFDASKAAPFTYWANYFLTELAY
ncbi:geranylgeranyl pyrophosphate synthase, chloroplastic [Ziziphus jujuba]|uniref:Geranylgeranyl pyrophosphate synthase, chloroplastic n=1 Tax=Ziziphus jujuba TaxID=326968 RepID=A0A6P4A2Z2_ZIZJJ|nr:geranylgeranyl pyrophosphate synthase, chloroplastic [Ziziphus jujuba]